MTNNQNVNHYLSTMTISNSSDNRMVAVVDKWISEVIPIAPVFEDTLFEAAIVTVSLYSEPGEMAEDRLTPKVVALCASFGYDEDTADRLADKVFEYISLPECHTLDYIDVYYNGTTYRVQPVSDEQIKAIFDKWVSEM